MKIVHVCLCGAMTDGFNYQENVITKYHKQMGMSVTIITSQWIWGSDGKQKRITSTGYVNEDGVKMIRLPIKYGTINNRLKTYPGLYSVLESENPDILFVHDCQFLNILTIAKYAKKNPNVKLYVDNHVDYSNGAHGWLSKNILHRGLWKYCVNKVEPYVTKFYGVLPARVDFLVDLYRLPQNKCELLVMGADDELVKKASDIEVRKSIRNKYNILDDDFLIITGGKIDLYKTQTLLLMQAVKNMQYPNIKLIVFGSVTDELKKQVKKLVDGENVQYIGWMDAKDSYPLFATADLVVFPGRHSVFWEQVAGQGIPMLVKYWDGTTHVDCGGNVEFLYQDSVSEIQNKIKGIIENKKYYSMKTAAIKASRKFMYSEIAKKSIEYK